MTPPAIASLAQASHLEVQAHMLVLIVIFRAGIRDLRGCQVMFSFAAFSFEFGRGLPGF